jgi:hypothetical protein
MEQIHSTLAPDGDEEEERDNNTYVYKMRLLTELIYTCIFVLQTNKTLRFKKQTNKTRRAW